MAAQDTTAAKKERVHLFLDSDGTYRVWPPVVVLKRGQDSVQIVNHTSSQARWKVDSPPLERRVDETVEGHRESSDPRAHGSNVGKFDYQVLVTGAEVRARGNSDPVIIIEN